MPSGSTTTRPIRFSPMERANPYPLGQVRQPLIAAIECVASGGLECSVS